MRRNRLKSGLLRGEGLVGSIDHPAHRLRTEEAGVRIAVPQTPVTELRTALVADPQVVVIKQRPPERFLQKLGDPARILYPR